MVEGSIYLKSKRAYEARLGRKIGKAGQQVLFAAAAVFVTIAVVLGIVERSHYAIILASPGVLAFMLAVWHRSYLSVLPTSGDSLNDRLSVDILSRLPANMDINCQNLFANLSDHWQSNFMLYHLLLPQKLVATQLEGLGPDQVILALRAAAEIADQNQNKTIELGYVIAGILLISPDITHLIISQKGQAEDISAVANWLGRNQYEISSRGTQSFGGIGRDWAFGFTPLLNRLGVNLSLSIAKYGSHFGWLMDSNGVKAMEAAFDNHATAIALVGQVGIGKTNSVYALAQRLIEGKTGQHLAYHQIIAINATDITSNARGPSDIEHMMVSIANEASHAGHIILFLDDAEAFFSEGYGSFNAAQILLSILQAKSVPIIMALTPNGFERIKSINPSLASLLTPVVLQELNEADVMRVLEDAALSFEHKNNLLISYEALHEAYKLSGRYDQDEAYPGRAIRLLEQALPYGIDSTITSRSIQQAIEQTKGVKLGNVGVAESSELLNLEDRIHERMINQTHAVSVVANSLRRARAGVTNPKRPIGSFLFLGPTGVGKTELAKALASTYFKDEDNMIRLDMSEYQQEGDVSRLLSSGKDETKSLIMAVRQKPFSVILLDEIEKAHPNILNLLLQLLDEGQLTDITGRAASFKDCIIIATSNAGSQTIRDKVSAGQTLESFETELTDELIKSNQFKPELLNRFDEIVLFRPLNPEELAKIVNLMLKEINKILANQNITVRLTDDAVNKIVSVGYDPRLGARPMRRTLQKAVEDTVAQKILRNEARPGDTLQLDVNDLNLG